MQSFHRLVRRIVPFLYERNWYTGVFEFSARRALVFCVSVALCGMLVFVIWWLGQPIEYTQPLP